MGVSGRRCDVQFSGPDSPVWRLGNAWLVRCHILKKGIVSLEGTEEADLFETQPAPVSD